MAKKVKTDAATKGERKGKKGAALSRQIVVSEGLLAMFRDREDREPVPMPQIPLPKSIGTEDIRLAHDKAVAVAADWMGEFGGGPGWGPLGGLGIAGQEMYFPGYPALAMLLQKAEFRRPAEIIAKTMTRKGFRLIATGDKDKTAKIRVLNQEVRRHGVIHKLRQVAELDGGFGRGQIYIDTGKSDELDELKTPLVLHKAKVAKGGTLRFTVVEPMWSYPAAYDSVDPLKKTFFRPEHWYVQQKEVHHSRLLTFVSREVPDILKPAYMFGGLSLTQMALVYVTNWLRAQQNVSDLIRNFATVGIKTEMGNLTQPGANAKFERRMELYNLMRDNRGLFALDKGEEFFLVAVPLSGLDKLQAQAQEHMAAVCGIPLVVFFGITPSGLNASSDGEIRAFYDWIHALQEQLFTPHLHTMLSLIQLNKFGFVDPEIHFEWVPLWQLDEAQLAAVAKTKADTDAVYLTNNVIDPEDVRNRLAGDETSMYHGIDPDDVPEVPDPIPAETGDPGANPAKGSEPGAEARSGV